MYDMNGVYSVSLMYTVISVASNMLRARHEEDVQLLAKV